MIILVPSCDAYSDAWEPFMGCLRHFWPSHPDVVFITNELEAPVSASTFKVGRDGGPESWCANLKKAIAASDPWTAEVFLVLQEDFFLSAPVDEGAILGAEWLVCEKDIDCVRLFPCPGADGPDVFSSLDIYSDPWGTVGGFGWVSEFAEYSMSCQAAIWEPAALARVLSDLTTAADFEIRGTQRRPAMGVSIAAWRREREPWPLQYICSAISRGKWNPDALLLCEKLGVRVDARRRGVDLTGPTLADGRTAEELLAGVAPR